MHTDDMAVGAAEYRLQYNYIYNYVEQACGAVSLVKAARCDGEGQARSQGSRARMTYGMRFQAPVRVPPFLFEHRRCWCRLALTMSDT